MLSRQSHPGAYSHDLMLLITHPQFLAFTSLRSQVGDPAEETSMCFPG